MRGRFDVFVGFQVSCRTAKRIANCASELLAATMQTIIDIALCHEKQADINFEKHIS